MMMITVAVMELLVDSFVRENIENWQNFYLEQTMMIIVVIIIVIILMYSFVDEKIENCENDNGYEAHHEEVSHLSQNIKIYLPFLAPPGALYVMMRYYILDPTANLLFEIFTHQSVTLQITTT